MSQHVASVVSFKLEKHPNADTLSVAKIRGWECVVKTEDFLKEKYGVYIPLDMIADKDHPLLGFLEGKKVKTKKLRGIISQGVLLPLSKVCTAYNTPKGILKEGTDVTTLLKLKRWEEPVKAPKGGSVQGEQTQISSPPGFEKYTDIENWNNFPDTIQEGEDVYITEKLHGTSARYALINGKIYLGSRNNCLRLGERVIKIPIFNKRIMKFLSYVKLDWLFKKDKILPEPNSWWHIAYHRENIEDKLKILSDLLGGADVLLFGEILGVQDLRYGVKDQNYTFYAYDVKILEQGFLPYNEFLTLMSASGIKTCPVLKSGKFILSDLDLRLGTTTLDDKHIREGIVIRPAIERVDRSLGRVILKRVSEDYLMRNKATDFTE